MTIKHVLPLAAFCTSLLLSACSKEVAAPRPEAIRPVKTLTLLDPASGTERGFPAKIEASKRASLSFRVPGQITRLDIKEGYLVEAGQVLAQLDPKDYELQLADAKADFERATNDWMRGKELVKEGHMARSDFDHLVSEHQQSSASYKQAQLNLSYVVLKAPFAGRVAKRYVENYAEVTSKQEIIPFRGTTDLDVRVDIPEQLMLHLQGDKNGAKAEVRFPLAGEQSYPITFKEVLSQADEDTQTFEVRFMLKKPADLNVLPGMSAKVRLHLPQALSTGWVIPAAALDMRGDQQRLWLLDDDKGIAHAVSVEYEAYDIGKIRVLSGVNIDDRVIVAGVRVLEEGMKVYAMATPEQADY